ncbi:hypothetical protein R6Q59_023319 [Mikania micrantha]
MRQRDMIGGETTGFNRWVWCHHQGYRPPEPSVPAASLSLLFFRSPFSFFTRRTCISLTAKGVCVATKPDLTCTAPFSMTLNQGFVSQV